MSEQETMAVMFEALLEQTRAVRDVKIQAESLKLVMFEHRPAFIPAFDEQVKKVTASIALRELDTLIGRLERAIRMLKAE